MNLDPLVLTVGMATFMIVAFTLAMPGVFILSYLWTMGQREKAIWIRMESDLQSERKERARLQILVDRLLLQLRESGIVPDSDSLYITDGELVYVQMDQYFNDSELIELARKLDVDLENIKGATKREKALNLSLFMERRGKTNELVAQLKAARPAVAW